jgi:release factor glutamine methyltransferase
MDVRAHEPRLALDGGADGLCAYRAIAADAPRLLAPGGALVVELGHQQCDAVCGIMAAARLVPRSPAKPDLAGISRALTLVLS